MGIIVGEKGLFSAHAMPFLGHVTGLGAYRFPFGGMFHILPKKAFAWTENSSFSLPRCPSQQVFPDNSEAESMIAHTGDTEEGRRCNRRVEVVFRMPDLPSSQEEGPPPPRQQLEARGEQR
jgi:hypothetical protein